MVAQSNTAFAAVTPQEAGALVEKLRQDKKVRVAQRFFIAPDDPRAAVTRRKRARAIKAEPHRGPPRPPGAGGAAQPGGHRAT